MKTLILSLIATLFVTGCVGSPRRYYDGKGVAVPQRPPCIQDVYEPPQRVIRRVHVPEPEYETVYIREGGCPPPIEPSPCPPPRFRYVEQGCPPPVRFNYFPPPRFRYVEQGCPPPQFNPCGPPGFRYGRW